MYCEKHKYMIRCNSIENSMCTVCKEGMITFNAPPINRVCNNCSKVENICEFCGEKIERGE